MKTTALTNKISTKFQQGFTLVELLVVIGILGVLVAALLATLDPLEQIRKGNDSARLSIAREYQQAYTRYYANTGYFPWDNPVAVTGCTTPGTDAPSTSASDDNILSSFTNCNAALVAAGELKSANIPANVNAAPNQLTITTDDIGGGVSGKVVTCFSPASKAQKAVANNNKLGAACTAGVGNPNGCFICVQ